MSLKNLVTSDNSSANFKTDCFNRLDQAIIEFPGDDLASTWVAKPEVHVENVEYLVNSSANYSCQRRQLRTRRLIPGRVLSDWSRVYASRFQASLS